MGEYQAVVVATDRAGNQAAQMAAGSVTAINGTVAPQTPALTINRVNAATLALTWNHVTQDVTGNPITVTAYRVYRSSIPQLAPFTLWQTVTGPFGATVTLQDTAPSILLGLTAYRVVAMTDVSGVAVPSSVSNAVGQFKFELSSGTP